MSLLGIEIKKESFVFDGIFVVFTGRHSLFYLHTIDFIAYHEKFNSYSVMANEKKVRKEFWLDKIFHDLLLMAIRRISPPTQSSLTSTTSSMVILQPSYLESYHYECGVNSGNRFFTNMYVFFYYIYIYIYIKGCCLEVSTITLHFFILTNIMD
jgi:hypothetical protein